MVYEQENEGREGMTSLGSGSRSATETIQYFYGQSVIHKIRKDSLQLALTANEILSSLPFSPLPSSSHFLSPLSLLSFSPFFLSHLFSAFLPFLDCLNPFSMMQRGNQTHGFLKCSLGGYKLSISVLLINSYIGLGWGL